VSFLPGVTFARFPAKARSRRWSTVAPWRSRPELTHASDRWIWKVIAEGKVGRKRTSIGLFLDLDLEPGTYALVGEERIKIVYSETPQSVIYHSVHFQSGAFTLFEANRETRRLRGQFSFSISAMDFAVTDGHFDVQCQ
jgi:hypothetical protein